jgi:hypothetical protein
MKRAASRVTGVGFVSSVLIAATAAPAAAHGIGGRADLPVPVSYFIVGAGIAIVASFIALAVLWPEPRLQNELPIRHLGGGRWFAGLQMALQALGLAGLLLVVLTGVFNTDGGRTISPVLVWVYFWLFVPFVGALIGNWWLKISPWRSLAGWINIGVAERKDLAAQWGMWPAAAAFVAFTWLELAWNSSSQPRTLGIAALAYSAYIITATRYLGVSSGLASAGAFENYNKVLSSMSAISWTEPPPGRSTARPAYRGWLRGLARVAVVPGFAFFVIAMIGSVTYDGMSGAGWWGDAFGTLRGETWFRTVALASTIAVIGTAYSGACLVAARMASHREGMAGVARTFAHTLVPIALAYAVAHYFTVILVEGQTLLHAASDPFGLGWDLFGTATWRISWVPAPEIVWYIQVAAIVAGHVTGVALAHDRALHDFGAAVAVRTQYAMLVLMVGLTTLGLLILAG